MTTTAQRAQPSAPVAHRAPAPVTVAQAVASAARAVGAVGKDGMNRQQGFRYRALDDLVSAVHGPLCDAGVVVVPEVLERHETPHRTRGGEEWYRVVLAVRWHITGPAGDELLAVTHGEGIDASDKATNKAMAGAMKYLLGYLLTVPFAGDEDSDATTPPARPVPAAASEDQRRELIAWRHRVEALPDCQTKKAAGDAWRAVAGRAGTLDLDHHQAAALLIRLAELELDIAAEEDRAAP